MYWPKFILVRFQSTWKFPSSKGPIWRMIIIMNMEDGLNWGFFFFFLRRHVVIWKLSIQCMSNSLIDETLSIDPSPSIILPYFCLVHIWLAMGLRSPYLARIPLSVRPPRGLPAEAGGGCEIRMDSRAPWPLRFGLARSFTNLEKS